MEFLDTICAISTPIGSGGISIVRMSGKNSLDIISKIISKPIEKLENRKLVLTDIKTKDFTDKALVVYFKAPYTYTGEDIVEIQCHGGIFLSQKILNELLLHGARLAENGEFTKRAFLNGKISLDGAEGVIDMINAETQSAVRAGYDLLNGELTKRVKVLQDKLSNVFAEIEVAIDYPEETIETSSRQQIYSFLDDATNMIDALIKTYIEGNFIKNGVRCAIVGAPNVGKSSTMNSLLGYNRAIVTQIAGTTRDTLEESFNYKGIKFILIDTAGIRESEDIVEKIGIERARTMLNSADIVLFLIDAFEGLNEEYKNLLYTLKDKKVLVVFNKIDLNANFENIKNEISKDFDTIEISAEKEIGINGLKDKLYSMVIDENITNAFMITNARHKDLLDKALINLNRAKQAIKENVDLDLINIDVVEAWHNLGEITGETADETRINTIFEKFCLGK